MNERHSQLLYIAEANDEQSDGSSEYGFWLDQHIDVALEIDPKIERDPVRWAIFAWETAIRMSPPYVEWRDDLESVELDRDEEDELVSELVFTVKRLPVRVVVPLDIEGRRLSDPPNNAKLDDVIEAAKASVRSSVALIEQAIDAAVAVIGR